MTPHPDSVRHVEAILDRDSFHRWDAPLVLGAVDPAYADQLRRAERSSGLDEALLTGEGLLHGHRVAVLASEYAFLGGSVGRRTAARLVEAVQRATRERLPLIGMPRSGGTRMQEGAVGFAELSTIAAAVTDHVRSGLPYLVHLRGPTTGGVLASWGALGQVTWAEPGAFLGFLGPRVLEAILGAGLADGVQSAENLAAHGVIDGVVSPAELRSLLGRTLTLLAVRRATRPSRPDIGTGGVPDRARTGWETVVASRRPDRPGLRELLGAGASSHVVLADPRLDGSGVLMALARFAGTTAVVVGHATGPGGSGRVTVAGLRRAQRGAELAQTWRLPLVTVIDTEGAELSARAEEAGLARELGRCLSMLHTLTVPRVSMLLGQGCGGAAVALLPADRVLAAEDSWLSPLPFEGASAIVHRDREHAAELANALDVRAVDLYDAGVVDALIPVGEDPASVVAHAATAIGTALDELLHLADERPIPVTGTREPTRRNVG